MEMYGGRFESNIATYGAAVLQIGSAGKVATFDSVAFIGNTDKNGGNEVDSGGTAICTSDDSLGDTLNLFNCTLTGNKATVGGAIFQKVATTTLNIVDSTFDGNITNGTGGNQIGTQATPLDPKLGALQNNGSKTFTHAPFNTSPAIDAGNTTLAVDAKGNPLTKDQRGCTQISGTSVDIGTFEF